MCTATQFEFSLREDILKTLRDTSLLEMDQLSKSGPLMYIGILLILYFTTTIPADFPKFFWFTFIIIVLLSTLRFFSSLIVKKDVRQYGKLWRNLFAGLTLAIATVWG